MLASFAGNTDVTGQAVASRRVRPRRPDSSPMPMRQRALNLKGTAMFRTPYACGLKRPLRVARSRGEPEGTEVGVGGEEKNKLRQPTGWSALHSRKPLGSPGLTCHLTSSPAARSPGKRRRRDAEITPLPHYRTTGNAAALVPGSTGDVHQGARWRGTDPRGGRSSSSDRLCGAEAEFRETRRPLDCQAQSRRRRRGRDSRPACCPQEEQRAADPAVGAAVGIVTMCSAVAVYHASGRRLQVPEVRYQNHLVPGFARLSRGSSATTSAGTASHASAQP